MKINKKCVGLCIFLSLSLIVLSIYKFSNAKESPILINQAHADELIELYGIGEVYANRIEQCRPKDGYEDLEHLLDTINYPKGEKRAIFIECNKDKISFK